MKNLDKRDRQGVRTPADLEQKYSFGKMAKNLQENTAALERRVEQMQTMLTQFIGQASASLADLHMAVDGIEWEMAHNFKKYHPNTSMFYIITNELTNCVSSNVSETQTEGLGYSAWITCEDECEITSYSAVMGGHSLDGVFTLRPDGSLRLSIDAVTDDLTITVVAVNV